MEIKEFFSPKQIYVGTFVGGPLAAAYFLGRNFKIMDKDRLNKLCKIFGVVLTVVLFGITFELPENFPSTLVPIAYSAVAAGMAWQWQVTKEEIEAVDLYGFKSNWIVAGISVASFIITITALFAVIMLLPIE